MYIYCVYTAILCIHKILKFTHVKAKTFDNLFESPIGCLQCVPCVTSTVCSLCDQCLYFTSLYTAFLWFLKLKFYLFKCSIIFIFRNYGQELYQNNNIQTNHINNNDGFNNNYNKNRNNCENNNYSRTHN